MSLDDRAEIRISAREMFNAAAEAACVEARRWTVFGHGVEDTRLAEGLAIALWPVSRARLVFS